MPKFRLPPNPTDLAVWLYDRVVATATGATGLRTYADVAAKIHTSPTTVMHVIKGDTISLDTLEALATGFDWPRDDLIARAGDQLEERARRLLRLAAPRRAGLPPDVPGLPADHTEQARLIAGYGFDRLTPEELHLLWLFIRALDSRRRDPPAG